MLRRGRVLPPHRRVAGAGTAWCEQQPVAAGRDASHVEHPVPGRGRQQEQVLPGVARRERVDADARQLPAGRARHRSGDLAARPEHGVDVPGGLSRPDREDGGLAEVVGALVDLGQPVARVAAAGVEKGDVTARRQLGCREIPAQPGPRLGVTEPAGLLGKHADPGQRVTSLIGHPPGDPAAVGRRRAGGRAGRAGRRLAGRYTRAHAGQQRPHRVGRRCRKSRLAPRSRRPPQRDRRHGRQAGTADQDRPGTRTGHRAAVPLRQVAPGVAAVAVLQRVPAGTQPGNEEPAVGPGHPGPDAGRADGRDADSLEGSGGSSLGDARDRAVVGSLGGEGLPFGQQPPLGGRGHGQRSAGGRGGNGSGAAPWLPG